MTGYALAAALAAPVDDGMMLAAAARPARQSLPFIAPCTVVMRPFLMPNFSLITLTSGASPFVVHDAHDTVSIVFGSYSSVFTPQTMVGVSASFAGAEMITFFAPPSRCRLQPSVVQNAPVDSHT